MRKQIKSAAQTLFDDPPDPIAAAALDMELLEARERWKERVFSAAVEFAINDETYRKRLAAKLRDLGEGRARRGITAFEAMQAASAVELFTTSFAGTRRDGHRLKMPRLFDEMARLLGVSRDQAKRRYYAAIDRGFLQPRRIVRVRAKSEKSS